VSLSIEFQNFRLTKNKDVTEHHPLHENGPINPDIGGPFVAVANIIINCYFASISVLSAIQFAYCFLD